MAGTLVSYNIVFLCVLKYFRNLNDRAHQVLIKHRLAIFKSPFIFSKLVLRSFKGCDMS